MTLTQSTPMTVATLADPLSRSLRGGETLYYGGDNAPNLYRLDAGLLRAVSLTSQGRTLTVRHILPGDLFGEEALSTGRRLYQVTALSDAAVRAIHPQHLGAPEVMEVARSLAVQVERLMADGIHLQDGDLRGRIARYLLTLAETSLGSRHADGLRFVRVTHELIAEGTGATRESVSKLIGEMRDDGLVMPAYRCLTLTDEAGLRDLAGAGRD
ncbi:helix-turn-helix domain-containing protein [Deinococcus ficus]|uniref:Crp/Fnr family transcriptional regulator n=1 Tax=Deinococcus ficus TaxID=317577 RepID=A0A221SV21_9DEIO|nr:helix-turn-helix domain-containing protein [Deinococcus ficus]ASN80463.1 Crp/Fnr family transcriptional regulator [Deinococcus ficus]